MEDIDLEKELASLDGGGDDEMLRILHGGSTTSSFSAPVEEIRKQRILVDCAYCGDPIKEKAIMALKHSYHPDHFLCSQCLEPMRSETFLEKKGKAYCEKVFTTLT